MALSLILIILYLSFIVLAIPCYISVRSLISQQVSSMLFNLLFNFFFVLFVNVVYLLIFLWRNQAGSSPAMEFMTFKQCMNYLIGYGLVITTFISDRHLSIASHMKKVLTGIVHYFDTWHLNKSKLNWFQRVLFNSLFFNNSTGIKKLSTERIKYYFCPKFSNVVLPST